MDIGVAIVVAALALAGAGIAVALIRRPAAPPAADAVPVVDALRASVDELRQTSAAAMAEMRAELQRTLGATEQQLVTQTSTTQRTLADVSRQLGALGEQSARIGELAKDIGSLQDLLRAPKPRGGFGELMLERLLRDCLPATAYEVQYTFRDGLRVDAIVRYGGRIVPVDAKFPNESYTQIAAARDDAERRARRRAFLQQVRKHVDAVARYISPQDSTIDYAFMYLPSEAIYYELTLGSESSDEPDILAYCADRHVIPASPNTLLAYLQVVALGIRGLAMQERTLDLQRGIAQVRREFDALAELHEQLGRHLDNATKKFETTRNQLARASGAIEAIAQVPLAAGGEQGVLPLGVADDER
ncbi:MAG TPA: DNA recombination protein RmuC [Candidatus Limnocylindria bacterium]